MDRVRKMLLLNDGRRISTDYIVSYGNIGTMVSYGLSVSLTINEVFDTRDIAEARVRFLDAIFGVLMED